MASTATLLKELFVRLASLEQNFIKLESNYIKLEQNKEYIPDIEPLTVSVQQLQFQLKNHIDNYNEVKKVTEQTLLLKVESLINKKINEIPQNVNEITILPPTVATDICINQIPHVPQLPTIKEKRKKDKNIGTTLDLE